MPRKRTPQKITVQTVMEEIELLKSKNPDKDAKAISDMYLESKRSEIIALLIDSAHNAESHSVRFNARALLKNELDGRAPTRIASDPESANVLIIMKDSMKQ